MPVADLLPTVDDLPGTGWQVLGDEVLGAGARGAAELFDCVGPEFPERDVLDTAASPNFLRPPGELVHGLSVRFAEDSAAAKAESILGGRDFAECLGRSVAADLTAGTDDAEILTVDPAVTRLGWRISFAGVSDRGVRPVHLDVVVRRIGRDLAILWFGDSPDPTVDRTVEHVLWSIARRLA